MGKFLDKHDGPLRRALRDIEATYSPEERRRAVEAIHEAAKLSPGSGRRAAMSRGFRRYRHR